MGSSTQEDRLQGHSHSQADELTLVGIVAVAANGVIGRSGQIPWHYPEDLKHFKNTTTGHPVIVGRKTHESIVDRLGKPLPNRQSIVMTTTGIDPQPRVTPVESTTAALTEAAAQASELGVETAYVAGGEQVYRALLPHLDRLIRTELNDPYAGNTMFPEWDRSDWSVVEECPHDEFTIVTYER